jgi:hypothetical protein
VDGIEDLSTIERLKILKSIRLGCASDIEFEPYLEKYSGGLTTAEVNRRIEGLLLEDEFLLLCKLMRACYSINGLDQGFTIDNDLKVPDYLALFDTRNCIYDSESILPKFSAFIEVKTTHKSESSKLGASFLRKYSAYAGLYDIPLLIASRLKINANQQWWVIQTLQQFTDSGRKASKECLYTGVGHIILNDFFITACQDIYVDTIFTKNPTESNICDPTNGYLKSVTIRSDGESITLDRHDFIYNLFLDCFAQESVSIKQFEDEVRITRLIHFMQDQLLSDMLLRANFCILDKKGYQYSSASRLLALLESDHASVVHREFFEEAICFFNSEATLFMMTKIGDASDNKKLMNSLLVDVK